MERALRISYLTLATELLDQNAPVREMASDDEVRGDTAVADDDSDCAWPCISPIGAELI
jgi:hypothetical protein